MKAPIKKVLLEYADRQVNLSSEAAREDLAEQIELAIAKWAKEFIEEDMKRVVNATGTHTLTTRDENPRPKN
jgi:hypothetical protein